MKLILLVANEQVIADGGEIEKPPPGNRSSIEKLLGEDKDKKPNSKCPARTKVE